VFETVDTLFTDMKIRKNDFVKLNIDLTVGTYHVKTIPAGTELQVGKTSRNGELRCYTVDRTICSYNVIVSSESVTKVEKPLPTVNVGDIFVSSWGYDQTNIDFYKVLNVKNKSAILVEIGQTRNYTGHMQGICIPDHTVVGKKLLTKRIQVVGNKPCFKLTSYASAFLWDGKNEHFTEWA
jgi:hypothetical protein